MRPLALLIVVGIYVGFLGIVAYQAASLIAQINKEIIYQPQ